MSPPLCSWTSASRLPSLRPLPDHGPQAAAPGPVLLVSPGLVWGSALGSLVMKLPGKVKSTQRQDHGMPEAPLNKLTFPVRPESHLLNVDCVPGPHRS